jgi:hypothetical protein
MYTQRVNARGVERIQIHKRAELRVEAVETADDSSEKKI